MRVSLTSNDCEHEGDIGIAEAIITKCGGKVLSYDFNYDREVCEFDIEIPDTLDEDKFYKDIEDSDWI